MRVAIAILAAGRGARMGGTLPKPLLLWQGKPLIRHALDVALAVDRSETSTRSASPVLAVLGYAAETVAAVLPASVIRVDNPAWQEGIASSLRATLAALAPERDVEAVCIGLADQPRVGVGAYVRLKAAFEAGAPFAVATYGGQRRNPVLLGRQVWAAASQLRGDAGAKQLMATRTVTEVPCDDTGDPFDIDTPTDLRTLSSGES